MSRNRYIDNEDGSVTLVVTQRNKTEHEYLIDAEDVDEASKYSWFVGTHGYLAALVDGKQVFMHCWLLDMTSEIDHRNTNHHDNRKVNLRPCTHHQNLCNRKAFNNNSLGLKGVSIQASYVRASTKMDGKQNYKMFSIPKLGLMPAVRDAAIAAMSMRNNLHGEFACH